LLASLGAIIKRGISPSESECFGKNFYDEFGAIEEAFQIKEEKRSGAIRGATAQHLAP
jgi:hypothetical protein